MPLFARGPIHRRYMSRQPALITPHTATLVSPICAKRPHHPPPGVGVVWDGVVIGEGCVGGDSGGDGGGGGQRWGWWS